MTFPLTFSDLRDRREPRRWDRFWETKAGLICCCTSGAQMYSLGGSDTFGATFYKVCDKTDMSAETTAAITTGNLSQSRQTNEGGIGNPSVAGYILGGSTGAAVVTADKLTFSNDTTVAVTTANLSSVRQQGGALSERSSKGYHAGGQSSASTLVADKLTFSGDSTAAVTTANLSLARFGVVGMSGTTAKGYFAGGATTTVTNSTNVAEKITFSSDTTTATTTANLSVARAQVQAGGDGSTKGYWAGGQTGAQASTVDKITFSSDTTAALTTASYNQWVASQASDGNKLATLGGTTSLGGTSSAGSKITFATDVVAGLSAAANLSQSRRSLAGFSTVAL